MSTGRAHEKDTLFLGAPANHAAKLVAENDEEGIFLTERARRVAGTSAIEHDARGDFRPNRIFLEDALAKHRFPRLEATVDRLVNERPHDVSFVFHRATPPLSSLTFAELTPSNSVRMGMASLFADIDGFTPFVDRAIQNGSAAIKLAATGIHVIREELNDVLKDDFGGKRVRFIGDCIHGVFAEGKREDDPQGAVRQSALCASGMRSSFSLCQEIVTGIDELDLAVGIEYGPVPLTRIGKRGDESVRCAAGRAVIISEAMQQAIDGGGVRLGPIAVTVADGRVQKYFGAATRILDYDDATDLLGAIASPAVSIARNDASARSHTRL